MKVLTSNKVLSSPHSGRQIIFNFSIAVKETCYIRALMLQAALPAFTSTLLQAWQVQALPGFTPPSRHNNYQLLCCCCWDLLLLTGNCSLYVFYNSHTLCKSYLMQYASSGAPFCQESIHITWAVFTRCEIYSGALNSSVSHIYAQLCVSTNFCTLVMKRLSSELKEKKKIK